MNPKDTRDFFFRGLLFEADAEKYRKAGIQIGVDSVKELESELNRTLAPFPISSRNRALEMGRLYSLLYCFENEVRNFIQQVLEDEYKSEWISSISKKIQGRAKDRMQKDKDNSWLEGVESNLLTYLDFGQLSDLIIDKWEIFSVHLPSQHWLKQRMDEIEQARNFIAHNRMLMPSEFRRLYMYISDWNKQVGL